MTNIFFLSGVLRQIGKRKKRITFFHILSKLFSTYSQHVRAKKMQSVFFWLKRGEHRAAMTDTEDPQAGLLKMVSIKVTQSGGQVYLTQVAAGGNQDASLTLQKAPSALDLNAEWSNRDTGYPMSTAYNVDGWGAAHVKYVIADAWG